MKANILKTFLLLFICHLSLAQTFDEVEVGDTGLEIRTKVNEAIDFSATEFNRKYWTGKKLVPIGDSQTAQGDDETGSWINTFVALMGLSYSTSDNMGVAGSGLMPYNNLGSVGDNSVYKRCSDVAAKSPDLIILLAGENDDPNLTLTVSEATYTGATFPTGSPACGIIGALKGCLKKLRDGSPDAVIVLMTNFVYTADSESDNQKKINRHLAFQQVAGLFNVVYIPNYQIPNIQSIHPTPSQGGTAIGRWISRQAF
jgi:hypothetical protein